MSGMSNMRSNLRLLSIDVTSECNLRCAHCFNESGTRAGDELSLHEICRIIDEAGDLHPENICLCGGEPMLKEGIFEIVSKAAHSALSVGMVSNGYLITADAAKNLAISGLSTIQISLDGAKDYQHDSLRGRKGSFFCACEAIKNLKQAGIRSVTADLIPNRMNAESLEEYFKLCAELEVDAVRFMPMMTVGRGRIFGRDLTLTGEEMFSFQRKLWELRRRYFGVFHSEWDDPVLTARYFCRQIINGFPPPFISIASDGCVYTDMYVPVCIGNARKEPLREILTAGLKKAVDDGCFNMVLDRLHELSQLYDVRKTLEKRRG